MALTLIHQTHRGARSTARAPVLESDSLALKAIIEEDGAINSMDAELTSHVFELIALRQPVARDTSSDSCGP